MDTKSIEVIISTQHGFSGAKLVEKESGSGNVILQRMELEGERQLAYPHHINDWGCEYPTGEPQMDYINFTKEAEFEYMPVSYQTGTYDQKWIEKLCVQNYRIGAVLTEMYTHAEYLQKKTEVKTRLYGWDPEVAHPPEIIYDIGDSYWGPRQICYGGTFDPKNQDYTRTSPTMGGDYQHYYFVSPSLTDGDPGGPFSYPVIKPGWTVPR